MIFILYDAIKVGNSTNLNNMYFYYFKGTGYDGYCVSFMNKTLNRRYDLGIHITLKKIDFGYWENNTYTRLWTISAS